MEYIIFGAGADGREALSCLGQRVGFFCDNALAGKKVCEKRVLSLEETVRRYAEGQSIIVIASSKYQTEMEQQLKRCGIKRFFVFNRTEWEIMKWEVWPRYMIYGTQEIMSYSEIMMRNNIEEYKHIAISDINKSLPYLLSEIAFQCGEWRIDYILSNRLNLVEEYMGVPVIEWNQFIEMNEVDCLVVNARRCDTSIFNIIMEKPSFEVLDIYDVSKHVPVYCHSGLRKFKDKHKGERCFIIGNGPSLKIGDLDKLYQNEEICFGVNRIYMSFPSTKWRPTYHCVADDMYIKMYDSEIDKKVCQVFYADSYHWSNIKKSSDVEYIHVVGEDYGKNMPGFSFDVAQYTYSGCNIIYDICLQLAVYMGFKEIYLLGTDCSMPNGIMRDDSHFVSGYCEGKVKELLKNFDFNSYWNKVMLAYKKAEQVSYLHDFRIYNATRGGALEEFERVDFDSLF